MRIDSLMTTCHEALSLNRRRIRVTFKKWVLSPCARASLRLMVCLRIQCDVRLKAGSFMHGFTRRSHKIKINYYIHCGAPKHTASERQRLRQHRQNCRSGRSHCNYLYEYTIYKIHDLRRRTWTTATTMTSLH